MLRFGANTYFAMFVVTHILPLAVGGVLFYASLAMLAEWTFRPMPVGVDSKALTMAVSAVFGHRQGFLIALFAAFLILWSGLGTIFTGSVRSGWRQAVSSASGLLLIIYSYVLATWVLRPITGEATYISYYFLFVAVLPIIGVAMYYASVQKLPSVFSITSRDIEDVEGCLDVIGRNTSIPNTLGDLKAECREDLLEQSKRLNGSIFSVVRFPNAVARTQERFRNLVDEAGKFVDSEISASLAPLKNPRFDQEARQALFKAFIKTDEHRRVGQAALDRIIRGEGNE